MRGIYIRKNQLGEIYVGHSFNLGRRKKDHKYWYNHARHLLQKSYEEFGEENHTFEIIFSDDTATRSKLRILEREFIRLFDRNGYSMLNIFETDSNLGKQNKKPRNKPAQNIQTLFYNREVLPKPHNGRNKRKVIATFPDGTKTNFETIKEAADYFNTSVALIGYAYKKKKRGFYSYDGKFKEVVLTLCKKATDRYRNFEIWDAKKVIQINKETGEPIATYNSLGEAMLATGINRFNIGRAASGKLKTCGGFAWKFLSAKTMKEDINNDK